MRKIKAKKLSKEAFAPFGAYYSMTEPEGKALCGELHAFYPDRVTAGTDHAVGTGCTEDTSPRSACLHFADFYLFGGKHESLWYGIGKPDQPDWDTMKFVIMIAIHKVKDPSLYRKDMFAAKRKPLQETWSGDDPGIADVARFAPSACNSQPWYVENTNGILTVHRYRKPGRIGIMPAKAVSYYNRIDIGIYLCFLELCMDHRKIGYTRTLFPDNGENAELTKVAEYTLCL